MKGNLILISGPSGSGKTTLRKMLYNDFPELKFSVSYTTRRKRDGETNGVDYFFVSKEEFQKMIENEEFIEYANVFGNFYGTSKAYVDKLLDQGHDVLLELDVQGGENVINLYNNLCSIFILPPSLEVLKERFFSRGTETEQEAKVRMETAIKELEKKDIYKYKIENDNLKEAYKELKKVVLKYID